MKLFDNGLDFSLRRNLRGRLRENPSKATARLEEGKDDISTQRNEFSLPFGNRIIEITASMNERSLPEEISLFDRADNLAFLVFQNDLAVLYDVERKGWLPPVEEFVIRLKVNLAEQAGVARIEQIDVTREKEIEGPIDHDTEFSINSRLFGQVDGTPHEPGDESGELKAHDTRDGGLVTN